MTALADNAPRLRPGKAHVESWFLRANHPTEPRALWVRSTALCRPDGTAEAEAWCMVFDGDEVAAFRSPIPLSEAQFTGAADQPLRARIGACSLDLGAEGGAASGALHAGGAEVVWDLRFDRLRGAMGAPLCLLPDRKLIDASFPKNKLLTPFPVAEFHGWLLFKERRWDLAGWWGMQGHNWGAANAPVYAWGHCLFLDGAGRPFALVEGASGRIRLGPVSSPILSMLTVRRGAEELRFDGLVDLWRQAPQIHFPGWSLAMKGPAGQAALAMEAQPTRMACLRYKNPVGEPGYCLNSKTAAVTLRLNPATGDGFSLSSPHGGALEFLQPQPEPRVQPVV